MEKEKLFDCEIIEILENRIKFSCNGNVYLQDIDSVIANPKERTNLKIGNICHIGELLLDLIDPI